MPAQGLSRRAARRGSTGLLATISVMAASDPAPDPQEPLPWSLLTQPPEFTALEAAIEDLKQAMQPSTPILESARLLESASLVIRDVTDGIEEYSQDTGSSHHKARHGTRRCNEPPPQFDQPPTLGHVSFLLS